MEITKIETVMFKDGRSNIVERVHWDIEGLKGSTKLAEPKHSFIAYEALSEETVKGWVLAKLDMNRIKKALDQKHKATLLPPWAEDFTFTEPEDIKAERLQWEYEAAVKRLAQYKLSEGRPELKEMQPTGEMAFNEETGELEPVMAEVVVQTAIEPLPATVEQTTYDEEGNATTETVPNPLIVKDDEERAAAEAIVKEMTQ